jgi:hypothetical protein
MGKEAWKKIILEAQCMCETCKRLAVQDNGGRD